MLCDLFCLARLRGLVHFRPCRPNHQTLPHPARGVAEPLNAHLRPSLSFTQPHPPTQTRIIQPAIDEANARGWTCVGPIPPDTVFLRASRGEFDTVVAMYHDQGHIVSVLPVSYPDFHSSTQTLSSFTQSSRSTLARGGIAPAASEDGRVQRHSQCHARPPDHPHLG